MTAGEPLAPARVVDLALELPAPPERVFRAPTADIDRWWPDASYCGG